MLLSAIHITEHYFFNNEPITFNFGGKYFFTVDSSNNITRKENEKYIRSFYSAKNIDLVTAIVGKNGIGKTTVLETIIEVLNNQGNYFKSFIIYENNESVFIKKNNNSPNFTSTNFTYEEYNSEKNLILYSPFIDYKERNYKCVDLKFDNIIKEDFKINSKLEKDLYDTDPILSHQYANELRFIEFQDSIFSNIIDKSFNIPKPNGYIISFNDFKVNYSGNKINFHNTPDKYRIVIQKLWNAIEDESKEIVGLQIPLVQIQLKLMKNYFIRYILQQLIKKMEEENHFLTTGNLPPLPNELLNKNNIKEILFWFLENHYVKFPNTKTTQPLPIKETKDFIIFFDHVLKSLHPKNERDKSQFNWNTKTIIIKKKQALELLKLQKKYIIKLSNYFEKKRSLGIDSLNFNNSRIYNLMNFEYSLLKLSSGEISLLNLFSRFYAYFKNTFFDEGLIPPKGDGYLLLIDEGDAGFHPEWKKKYINIILKFLEAFFEKLETKVQIIFTTHDPLTLSDIPNYNIVYLSEKQGKKIVLNELEKPQKSFGANINDLLSDSFFIADGLIGDFAKSKINEVISWLNFELNSKKNKQIKSQFKNKEYYGKLIEIIDEPIIKNKLRGMYIEVTQDEKFIDLEIERLQNLKNKR